MVTYTIDQFQKSHLNSIKETWTLKFFLRQQIMSVISFKFQLK